MKRLWTPLVIIAMLVIVGAAAFWYGRTKAENETVIREENLITETETTISGEIIRAGLADIGELATEEYYFTEVEAFDSSKKLMDFDIPFTTSKVVYSYDGVIKAGIDFGAIDVRKDDQTKTITVKLPKSTILSSEIDENSFQVYDEKQSIFNPVSIRNFNDTLADLKTRAEREAISKKVLEKADANAAVILKNFLHSTYDVSEYKIEVVVKE